MNDPDNAPDFGLGAALATLKGLLTDGEALEAWAAQHRLYALTHRRVCIAATSGRFLSVNRRLLGGYESADIRWQDLKETRIRAGIIAADLTLVAQASSDLSIGSEVNRVWTFEGLHKDQAHAALFAPYLIMLLANPVHRLRLILVQALETPHAIHLGADIQIGAALRGQDQVGGDDSGADGRSGYEPSANPRCANSHRLGRTID